MVFPRFLVERLHQLFHHRRKFWSLKCHVVFGIPECQEQPVANVDKVDRGGIAYLEHRANKRCCIGTG